MIQGSARYAIETASKICAREFGLGASFDEATSEWCCAHVVRVRHLAMYILRKNFGWSLARVGDAFRRDHSTVRAAVIKLDYKARQDEKLSFILFEALTEKKPIKETIQSSNEYQRFAA